MPNLVEYEAEARTLIEEDIAKLRKLTFGEAMSLPEVSSARELTLGGVACSITVFAQRDTYNLPGSVLVTVLVARTRFFGAVSFHIERGLVFSRDGSVREATERELESSGG